MHKTKYVIEDELYTECVKIHPEALNTLEPFSIAAFYSQQEDKNRMQCILSGLCGHCPECLLLPSSPPGSKVICIVATALLAGGGGPNDCFCLVRTVLLC